MFGQPRWLSSGPSGARRGGPWDWSRGMREQHGWDEHAALMDRLVEEGFVVLGGPLEGEREVLLVVDAPSEQAVHDRLAEDNWSASGMLETVSRRALDDPARRALLRVPAPPGRLQERSLCPGRANPCGEIGTQTFHPGLRDWVATVTWNVRSGRRARPTSLQSPP